MAAELDLQGSTIAERYRVLSPLGEGAMGSVYLAEDVHLHRQVALKVLRKEWVEKPEVAKRLENECRLMAHLGPHSNIVTLYDRLVVDGNVVLVMEFMPGETLADIIERTRVVNDDSLSKRQTTPVLAGVATILLTQTDAIEVARQCLVGLDFAHSKGILHRDIKPANIMVARDHNGNLVAKLMDFGIGKALADGSDAPDAMTALTHVGGPGPGTPAYMAPEQIDSQRFGEVGPPADVYAFAVTLFEMLALRLPFEGTYTELLHAHTNLAPPDPRKAIPHLPPTIARVLLKGLSKDPAQRYPTAQRFRLDLEGLSPAQDGRDELPTHPRSPLSSTIALGIAGIAALLLLGIVGYLVWLQLDGGSSPAPVASPPTAEVEQVPAPVTPEPVVQPPPGPPPALEYARAQVERLASDIARDMPPPSSPQPPLPDLPNALTHAEAAKRAYDEGKWEEAEAEYGKARVDYLKTEDVLSQWKTIEADKIGAAETAAARIAEERAQDEKLTADRIAAEKAESERIAAQKAAAQLEAAKREAARQEEARREKVRQEEAKREKARQEEAKREKARQEEAKREKARQEEAIREANPPDSPVRWSPPEPLNPLQ